MIYAKWTVYHQYDSNLVEINLLALVTLLNLSATLALVTHLHLSATKWFKHALK